MTIILVYDNKEVQYTNISYAELIHSFNFTMNISAYKKKTNSFPNLDGVKEIRIKR